MRWLNKVLLAIEAAFVVFLLHRDLPKWLGAADESRLAERTSRMAERPAPHFQPIPRPVDSAIIGRRLHAHPGPPESKPPIGRAEAEHKADELRRSRCKADRIRRVRQIQRLIMEQMIRQYEDDQRALERFLFRREEAP